MDSLIRTIVNTVIRAAVYKGMRGTKGVTLVIVVAVAALVMIVTRR